MTVYITQQPMRFDYDSGHMVNDKDLSPAEAFGSLVFMCPSHDLPRDPATLVEMMDKHLRNFTAEDLLLLVGNPRLIAIASALAVRSTGGRLRLLDWVRKDRRYAVVDVNIDCPEPEAIVQFHRK